MRRYYLDLFAGVGGFALGAHWAGLRFDGLIFRMTKIDFEAVKEYLERGYGYKEIAEALKIHRSAVYGQVFRNPILYGIYVEKQTEKRILANGVMNRTAVRKEEKQRGEGFVEK